MGFLIFLLQSSIDLRHWTKRNPWLMFQGRLVSWPMVSILFNKRARNYTTFCYSFIVLWRQTRKICQTPDDCSCMRGPCWGQLKSELPVHSQADEPYQLTVVMIHWVSGRCAILHCVTIDYCKIICVNSGIGQTGSNFSFSTYWLYDLGKVT